MSPKYAEQKERDYPGRQILVRTGKLKASLTGKTVDTIRIIHPLQMALGTTIPYAGYHQRGTPTMPRRPVVELTEQDKRSWTKIIQRFLVEEAKKISRGT